MNMTNIVTFRTSEGKNGKTNYSRFYPNNKTKNVRSSEVDFNIFKSKADSFTTEVDGKFIVYNFYFG